LDRSLRSQYRPLFGSGRTPITEMGGTTNRTAITVTLDQRLSGHKLIDSYGQWAIEALEP